MSTLCDLPSSIEVSAEDGLRVIALIRPDDLNASTTEMLKSYPRLFRSLVEDRQARVAILTDAGRRRCPTSC